jgi:nucleoside-diphosphate-sugar epimerase
VSTYLVTGVAGFIASKVAEFLLADGHTVVGIDNLNDAYDVRLKHWRLAQLEGKPRFEFHRMDICDRKGLRGLKGQRGRGAEEQGSAPFDAVVNLAARAGKQGGAAAGPSPRLSARLAAAGRLCRGRGCVGALV